jgi:putative oxidoreductase
MELDLGLLMLRLVAGLIFAAHGAQKTFGWWNGPGPDGWRGAMEHMQFRPPAFFAAVSIGAELIGGPLLALGLLTPVAVAVLMAQSVVIIVVVHLPKGFFTMNGSIEFPFTLATLLTVLTATGPGRLSIDAAANIAFSNAVRWELYLLGLAAGLVAVGWRRAAGGARLAARGWRRAAGLGQRPAARSVRRIAAVRSSQSGTSARW